MKIAGVIVAALGAALLTGCAQHATTGTASQRITFADCALADSQKWSKNPAISKPAAALLNTQACQNFEQYGTATAPPQTPAPQWIVNGDARVINPDITTSFYEPVLRYEITNAGTAAGYSPTYEVVYFHDGQQVGTQDIPGGNFIAAGQTISETTAVPSAITEPAPDQHDWTIIPYPVTLKFYGPS